MRLAQHSQLVGFIYRTTLFTPYFVDNLKTAQILQQTEIPTLQSVHQVSSVVIRHLRACSPYLIFTAWVTSFPQPPPVGHPLDPGILPQTWKDFLDAAVQSGTIPNIPQATAVNGSPTYPAGTNPNSPNICSAFAKQCRMDGDIWDAPSGYVALGFDDGPYEVSG